MSDTDQSGDAASVEVRTYFVREHNALVARAEFSDLYVDYYLHQGQLGVQHSPEHDQLFKEALAAMTLHCASRPWSESHAWTVHFQRPLLNLFVTGDNEAGTVVGQIFTENVKDTGRNLFLADWVKNRVPARRSSVEFTGSDPFRAVEAFYSASEQRPARLFRYDEEDFVFVAAQPDCDFDWFNGLDDEAIRSLDKNATLSLLETRRYRWHCGCTEERMLQVLSAPMKSDPEGLFGEDPVLRMRCPRCGRRYVITRETLEAYIAARQ